MTTRQADGRLKSSLNRTVEEAWKNRGSLAQASGAFRNAWIAHVDIEESDLQDDIDAAIESAYHYWDHLEDTPEQNPYYSGGSNKSYDWPGLRSCNDWIDFRQMDFNRGNIAKAVDRWGSKPGVPLEYDLEKIIYFAERELHKLRNKKQTVYPK